MPGRRHSALLFKLAVDGGVLEHVSETTRLLEVAVRQDDPQTYHRQSRRFHIGMTPPSRMLRLMHMLESTWKTTEPVQAMVHVERLLAAATMHHHHLNQVLATPSARQRTDRTR
jgi:DNA-binding GntR family transcriptional regulator